MPKLLDCDAYLVPHVATIKELNHIEAMTPLAIAAALYNQHGVRVPALGDIPEAKPDSLKHLAALIKYILRKRKPRMDPAVIRARRRVAEARKVLRQAEAALKAMKP